MRTVFALIVLLFLSGCANYHLQKEQNERSRYLAMSKEECKSAISVQDDSLEPIAVLSTARVFQERHGFLNIVHSDFALRGFIEKKKGIKSIQVYALLKHTNGQWLHPSQAHYGEPLQSSSVTKISSDVDCKNRELHNRSCVYREDVGFTIVPKEVERIKNLAKKQSDNGMWPFKIKTRAGKDVRAEFTINEFAALLEKMDEYTPVATQ